MIKKCLNQMRRLLPLVGVLSVGMVLGGAVILTLTGGGLSELVSVAQAQESDEPAGLLISRVVAESPADKVGVVRGDIILSVDGQAINTVLELREYLADQDPETDVTLIVQHGDDQKTLTATLGERNGTPYLGVVPCGGHLRMGEFPGERLERKFFAQPGIMMMTGEVVVIEVVEDSPAAEAGLQAGDVIVTVDRQALDEDHDLTTVITGFAPGDVVILEITRDDQPETLTVTLGEHPDQADLAFLGVSYGADYTAEFDGLHFRGMPGSPAMPRLKGIRPGDMGKRHERLYRFALPEGDVDQSGVIIRAVTEDSPAAEAGLQAGDLIIAANDEPLDGPRELADLVADHQPGDTLTLTIANQEDDGQREVDVVLAEDPTEAGKAILGVQIGGFHRILKFEGPHDTEDTILEWFQEDRPLYRFFREEGEVGEIPELYFEDGHFNFHFEDLEDLLEGIPFEDGSL